MPVEVMAQRGADTLRFGPLKPVGLRDPRTGHRPWAVVQLRQENREKTLYNLVGFQTNLRFPEQRRVFSMIPALKNAEFVRYGVMHRNTFIDSPRLLRRDFSMKHGPTCFCRAAHRAGRILSRDVFGPVSREERGSALPGQRNAGSSERNHDGCLKPLYQ